MILSLWLPILLSAVALFFASFLSWMVLQLHKKDWSKLPNEEAFLEAVRQQNAPPGSYMFPMACSHEEMKSEAHQQKWKNGPRGVMTLFADSSMGKNLVLTFLLFLAVSFCLAYLTTLALPAGAEFLAVFRFVATAAFMTFVTGIVQHSIWFKNRIVGQVIESIAYAAITGALFASLWPK